MAPGRLLLRPGPWWKRTDELYETVRIGAGLESTGELGEDAMARGLETLSVFGRFCRANRIAPADVHPVATSAIRDAANGAAFLAEAEQAGAMEIEVLSAADEAHYGYVAAVNTTTLRDGVVLDIGGGSLQLTSVADRRAGPSASFPLGAVRITEQFLSADRPAKKKELARVRAHVAKALKTLDWVADSGRAAGRHGRRGAQPGRCGPGDRRRCRPRRPGLRHRARRRSASSSVASPRCDPEQRGSIPGIKPGRGDIILASALVLEAVVQRGGFSGIEATEAGLREGLFLARTLLAGSSRCSRMSVPPPCAASRSSTSPISFTSNTSRRSRCRCSTRSSPAGCSPRRG